MRAGLATTPGTVPTVHACVAYVRKIKFFKGCCNSKSKIHVTAGHSTVMATVQFFGWQEAQEQAKAAAQGSANEGESKGGVVVPRNWSPPVFDAGEEYCFQDALVTPKEGAKLGQYALLEFDTPLITPIGSIIIASRLDTETTTDACRLVFHGKVRKFTRINT